MPIGIFILGVIVLVVLLFVLVSKLDFSQLGTLEFILYGGFLLVVSGVIIYIIILSFFDNAAAIELLKGLIEIL
jgi:hypothetical protein